MDGALKYYIFNGKDRVEIKTIPTKNTYLIPEKEYEARDIGIVKLRKEFVTDNIKSALFCGA